MAAANKIQPVLLPRLSVAGLLAVLVTLSGCASTARLHAWRPADLDVPDLHRLAVLNFNSSDNTGELVCSALVAELSENRFYALVDQAELGPVVVGASGASRGKIDLAAAIDAGRRLGLDALLTGDVVSYHVTDNVVRDSRIPPLDERPRYPGVAPDPLFQRGPALHREAMVSLDFRLVEVRSGQVCASRQVVCTLRNLPERSDTPPRSRDEVLADLLHQCVRDVVAKIAPHQEECEVKLASGWWGAAASDIRRGNGYAAEGDWEEAARCYDKALEKEPDNHAALYNRALAYEARCEYATAGELAAKARNAHGCDLYAEAQQRIQQSDEAHRSLWLQQFEQATAPQGRIR